MMPLMSELAEEQLISCAQAVARLATHRKITPTLVHYVEHDREIRAVLDGVIRRWSKLLQITYITDTAQEAPKQQTAIEHVVPCRVLVDRMIMNPRLVRRILEDAVVLARVTKDEHSRLGGIYTHHRRLYLWMLKSPVAKLPGQGLRRYQKAGIKLTRLVA
jgi:hypothetical protein